MNDKQYALAWEKESKQYNEKNKIYDKLSKLIPCGKVLEIGCGIGAGTYFLSLEHEVLSLDNNKFLINKAKNFINNQKIKYKSQKEHKYKIHNCELLELTSKDKEIIKEFKPNIIVGWFIGTAGNIVDKYISDENNIDDKVKLYREKIEDIIVSNDILVDSVEIINLVGRGTLNPGYSKEDIFSSQKEDYDTYVFKKVGFEVIKVEVINWNISNSSFNYTNKDKNTNVFLSIIAKRIINN